MGNAFSDALSGLAKAMPAVIHDFEKLRLAATLDSEQSQTSARAAVLEWAEMRSEISLPGKAWAFDEFEVDKGGFRISTSRIFDQVDMWALRFEEPDPHVEKRRWITEVFIGGKHGQKPRLSIRVIGRTPEPSLDAAPRSPGFMPRIMRRAKLSRGQEPLSFRPEAIDTEDKAQLLCDDILDVERRLPIIAVTMPDNGSDIAAIPIDVLAGKLAGLARVAQIESEQTFVLSRRFGKFRSVYGGAVRIYWPGYSDSDDPYRHRLTLADRLSSPEEKAQFMDWLCEVVATFNLEANRLGRDVLEFSEIRATSSKLAAMKAREAAFEGEREARSDDLIAQLEDEIARKNLEIEAYVDEVEATEARARASEREYQSLLYRIRVLESSQTKETRPQRDIVPQSWHELGDWISRTWPDRVLLTPSAKRMLRNPAFEDLPAVVRAINWLAQEHYERRLNGGGSLRELAIEPGIRNAACGSDRYSVSWRGQTYEVDWHIKNGGNTRDPRRCLRIYYFWDPQTQITVIDHLPSHRDNEIT